MIYDLQNKSLKSISYSRHVARTADNIFDRFKNKIKAKDTDEMKTTILQKVLISNVDGSFP